MAKQPRTEVEIRAARIEDADALARVYSDRGAQTQTLQLPFASRELWRKRLADQTENQYGLVACIDGEVVGSLGLTRLMRARRAHVGEIGMGVRDQWQGKGIGSALLRAALDLADNWLGLRRIELTVYTDNKRAIGLYQRFGFEIEGTHRAFAVRDGAYVDAYSMARVVAGPQVGGGKRGPSGKRNV